MDDIDSPVHCQPAAMLLPRGKAHSERGSSSAMCYNNHAHKLPPGTRESLLGETHSDDSVSYSSGTKQSAPRFQANSLGQVWTGSKGTGNKRSAHGWERIIDRVRGHVLSDESSDMQTSDEASSNHSGPPSCVTHRSSASRESSEESTSGHSITNDRPPLHRSKTAYCVPSRSDLQRKHQQAGSTQICCHFLRGQCNYGSSCWWQHPSVPQHKAITCRFGNSCKYFHGLHHASYRDLVQQGNKSSVLQITQKAGNFANDEKSQFVQGMSTCRCRDACSTSNESTCQPPASDLTMRQASGKNILLRSRAHVTLPDDNSIDAVPVVEKQDSQVESEEQPLQKKMQKVCCFFLRSCCTYEDRCKWRHPLLPLLSGLQAASCHLGPRCKYRHGAENVGQSSLPEQGALWTEPTQAAGALGLLCGKWQSKADCGRIEHHTVALEIAAGHIDCARLVCRSAVTGYSQPRHVMSYVVCQGGNIELVSDTLLHLMRVNATHAIWISTLHLDAFPSIWTRA